MSRNRGRNSFSLRAACAAAAVLLAAGSGCQESTAPAASQTSFDAARSSGGGNPAATTGPAASSRSQPIRDISFDKVKLNMKKGDQFQRALITPAIEKLDGNRVRIRGYIFPTLQQTGLPRFILVRDNQACCFGPNAAIYDSMIVDMEPGLTTDYSLSPITVEGTFNIRPIEADGNTIAIYHLTAETVK